MAILETTTKLGPGLIAPTAKAAMILMKTPAEDIGDLSFGFERAPGALRLHPRLPMVVRPVYQLCRWRSRVVEGRRSADGL
jgi:hypothetical protein